MSSTPQLKNNSIHNLRRNQRRMLKKEIKTTLLQFRLSHLLSNSVVDLFELDPQEVKDKIAQLKLPAKKESIADLLIHRCKEFKLQELEDILYSLKLYKVIFKRKSKTWKTAQLLDPTEDFHCSSDRKTISLNILQALRIKGLNAVVKVFEHEEMFWTMIIGKKRTRNRGIRLQAPVFFCFELATPFLFFGSSVSPEFMNCILKAMQYQRHKIYNLQGRDVKSLLVLLKHKADHRGAVEPVILQTDEPEISHRCLDFSKRKARKAYVEKVLSTKEPVSLETITVHADAVMRENSIVPSMAGESFKATLQFKSKNVFEMIKYAVVNDIVATPVPEYLRAVLRSGKNKIDMRIPQSK